MGRTKLAPQRTFNTRPTYIGRIIIFCEGDTEQCYFNYYAETISKNKYTNIKIILKPAKGNSVTVLNCANEFFKNEDNNRDFGKYDKYLVFDCDDPPDIQKVLQAAQEYELLISNNFFETWLLMYFEDVNVQMSKHAVLTKLTNHLSTDYAKGKTGIIGKIIQTGNAQNAITCAKSLEQKYTDAGKNICADIKEMNPYTSVYKLVEQFLIQIAK